MRIGRNLGEKLLIRKSDKPEMPPGKFDPLEHGVGRAIDSLFLLQLLPARLLPSGGVLPGCNSRDGRVPRSPAPDFTREKCVQVLLTKELHGVLLDCRAPWL